MITLVHDDQGDWIAVYKDGKLLDQGHSFDESSLLRLLGIKYESYWEIDIESYGFRFPDSLNEIDLVNAHGMGEDGVEV